MESQQREFTVLSETDLRTPEQFNDLVITSYALTAYAALFALGLALDNERKHMDRRVRQ